MLTPVTLRAAPFPAFDREWERTTRRHPAVPTARAPSWLAVVLCAALAACSASQPETNHEDLTVLLSDDWAVAPAVVDAVRDFEDDHPDVRVQIQGLPFAQIMDTVAAGVDNGDPPDLVQEHAFAAAARDLAVNLDERWEADLDPAEFLPGAVEDVTWGNGRFGVPLDVNAMVLFVNADGFERLGVELSRGVLTFGELADMARAATDEQRRGIALAGSSWTTYGWIQANGGEVVTVGPDGEPRFSFTDPAVVETLDFLGELVREGVAFPPESRDVSTDAYALFESETTLLHASGTWELALLEENVGWEPRVLELPRGVDGTSRGSVLGGSSLFIPRGSEQSDLAWEFALHLTDDAYALRLAEEDGRLPARDRLYDAAFFDTPAYRTVREQLQTAQPLLLPAFPQAALAFKDAYEAVLTGHADALEALETAQLIVTEGD